MNGEEKFGIVPNTETAAEVLARDMLVRVKRRLDLLIGSRISAVNADVEAAISIVAQELRDMTQLVYNKLSVLTGGDGSDEDLRRFRSNVIGKKEPSEAPAKDRRPMNFGDAIQAMKAGARVQRAGWNGKGMWLFLADIPAVKVDCRLALGDVVGLRPCICMFDAQKMIVPGWLASQTDMLADDWAVVT